MKRTIMSMAVLFIISISIIYVFDEKPYWNPLSMDGEKTEKTDNYYYSFNKEKNQIEIRQSVSCLNHKIKTKLVTNNKIITEVEVNLLTTNTCLTATSQKTNIVDLETESLFYRLYKVEDGKKIFYHKTTKTY